MLLKLQEITIHVRIHSTSTFTGFAPKDSARKTEVFAYITY